MYLYANICSFFTFILSLDPTWICTYMYLHVFTMYLYVPICTYIPPTLPIWTYVGLCGPMRAYVGLYVPIWPLYVSICTDFAFFKFLLSLDLNYICTYMYLHVPTCSYIPFILPIYTYMDLYGPIWTYLDLFRPICTDFAIITPLSP
jgi:hypothetical protein